MLMNVSSDYLYLFSVDDQITQTENNSESPKPFLTFIKKSMKEHNKSHPLRRLRLRGDWSDTGPNARPSTENGMFVQIRA